MTAEASSDLTKQLERVRMMLQRLHGRLTESVR